MIQRPLNWDWLDAMNGIQNTRCLLKSLLTSCLNITQHVTVNYKVLFYMPIILFYNRPCLSLVFVHSHHLLHREGSMDENMSYNIYCGLLIWEWLQLHVRLPICKQWTRLHVKPPRRSLSRTRHLSREQHSSNKNTARQNNNEPEVQNHGWDLKDMKGHRESHRPDP